MEYTTTTQISVWIPDTLLKDFDEACKKQFRNRSQVIKTLMYDFIQEYNDR